jgi:hypothetical protein
MRPSRDIPAAGERLEHDFAEGTRRRRPRRPGHGHFSDGLASRVLRWYRPRFSRGIERRPDGPWEEARGHFSEGMEHPSARE